jgi:large subunit ribosomal protein L10
VDYRGISVSQAAELRSKLRENDASFRVVKNRLTKLAADKAGEERLADLLQGPTALTFVSGDTAAAAKAISTFNKEHDILAFKGGFMADLELDEEKFKSIARLPGRDVLDGQLAGVIASPLTGLVRGLGSMIQGLASQLGQIAQNGLVPGAPPAEAASDGASDEVAESADEGSQGDDAPADGSGSEAEQPSDDADQPSADDDPSDTPSEEAEGPDASAEASPAGEADVPAEEPPTESGAEAETPADDDPSQAEGEDDAAETSDDDSTSETSDETSKEEE